MRKGGLKVHAIMEAFSLYGLFSAAVPTVALVSSLRAVLLLAEVFVEFAAEHLLHAIFEELVKERMKLLLVHELFEEILRKVWLLLVHNNYSERSRNEGVRDPGDNFTASFCRAALRSTSIQFYGKLARIFLEPNKIIYTTILILAKKK